MSSAADRALLAKDKDPFGEAIARLDSDAPPPAHVEEIHAEARSEMRRALEDVARGKASLVLVKGDPGQGKTHELKLLQNAASQAHRYHFVEIPPLKDAGAGFSHTLRYLAQGLAAQGALERFLWGALRRVAESLRERARLEGDDGVADRLDYVLLGDPRYTDAFRALVMQDRSIAELLRQRGPTVPPLTSLDPEFGRVLCRLPDSTAEAPLVEWLRGSDLPDDELRALGLKESLDSEGRCFEILRALVKISPRPFALCFDQLEATFNLVGEKGITSLFHVLMELYQQLSLCLVVMCQNQAWGALRPHVPAALRDRLRELPPLSTPTPDEAARLVSARLRSTWAAAGISPPYATYPFSADYLRWLVTSQRPTLRGIVLHCGERLGEMRRAGAIRELAAPAEQPALPRPDPRAALRGRHRTFVEQARRSHDLATADARQDRLRAAVAHVLQAAQVARKPFAGVTVESVHVPDKPEKGRAQPMLIGVCAARQKARRVALEVDSRPGNGAFHALRRLQDAVERGDADAGVLLREEDEAIAKTAARSHELVEALQARSGGLSYLALGQVHELVGAELLLEAAASAGQRDEVLSFLLEHEPIGAALAPALSKVTLPAAAAKTPPHSSHDLASRLHQLLRESGPALAQPRAAAALGVAESDLDAVVAEEERKGTIRRALDRGGTKTIFPGGARA